MTSSLLNRSKKRIFFSQGIDEHLNYFMFINININIVYKAISFSRLQGVSFLK